MLQVAVKRALILGMARGGGLPGFDSPGSDCVRFETEHGGTGNLNLRTGGPGSRPAFGR